MIIPFVTQFSLILFCSPLQNECLISVNKYVVPFCVLIKYEIY